jgi:RNA polymerase sigma-70 factor (ECF subfamily)
LSDLSVVPLTAIAESEAALLERFTRCEPEAMADLYGRYGRAAYSLIYRIVRDRGTAEDLVQETFLRVWSGMRTFDGQKGALGNWLLTIARHRAIDHLRSSSSRMGRAACEMGPSTDTSLSGSFETQMLNLDRVRCIAKALKTLNANHRRVIELAYFDGLSHTEMAKRLGEPLGTVKTWVRSALNNLREELGAGCRSAASLDSSLAQSRRT